MFGRFGNCRHIASTIGETLTQFMDHWNELIKVMRDESLSQDIRDYAKILLAQYNTASGIRMEADIERFILTNDKTSYGDAYKAFRENDYKIQTIKPMVQHRR
jgi:hypothetical protein